MSRIGLTISTSTDSMREIVEREPTIGVRIPASAMFRRSVARLISGLGDLSRGGGDFRSSDASLPRYAPSHSGGAPSCVKACRFDVFRRGIDGVRRKLDAGRNTTETVGRRGETEARNWISGDVKGRRLLQNGQAMWRAHLHCLTPIAERQAGRRGWHGGRGSNWRAQRRPVVSRPPRRM